MAARLVYPHARTRAQSPIPKTHKTHPYRRIRELETLADGLLGLLKLCDQRRQAAIEELEALKGGRP